MPSHRNSVQLAGSPLPTPDGAMPLRHDRPLLARAAKLRHCQDEEFSRPVTEQHSAT